MNDPRGQEAGEDGESRRSAALEDAAAQTEEERTSCRLALRNSCWI